MNTFIQFCIEKFRIKSPLGDMVEGKYCSNYPDCPPECKREHKKKEVQS